MSRYNNTIISKYNSEEAAQIAAKFLSDEGFVQKTVKGESFWQKGSGILTGPQFIRLSAGENHAVNIEAWIKFAVLPLVYVGEMGIDGMVGAAPKAMLKKRVKKLEEILTV